MSDQYPGSDPSGSSENNYPQEPPTQAFGTSSSQGSQTYGGRYGHHGGGNSGGYSTEGYGGGAPYVTAQQPQGATYGEPPLAQNSDAAGFFRALFDFSFNHFITPKVVKFVYMLSVVGLGLLWLVFLLSAFSKSVLAGLGVLIVGPIIVVLYLVFIRMTLEFYLATVRMSQDIHERLR